MGTITGTQIASRARRVLQDQSSGGTRWLDAELLDWINDAQREIVLLKPEASSKIIDHTCVAGTKQTIPSDGIRLLTVIRNTSGKSIRRVDRNVLDSENPNWHQTTANNVAEHFVFDEDMPTTFFLYPPRTGTPGQVEITYSAAPTDLAALGDVIYLNDIYANPLLDFLLYRAYLKDTDYAGNAQRAATHYQAFQASIGGKRMSDAETTPNANVRTGRAGGSN
jgi:hypothetical protein